MQSARTTSTNPTTLFEDVIQAGMRYHQAPHQQPNEYYPTNTPLYPVMPRELPAAVMLSVPPQPRKTSSSSYQNQELCLSSDLNTTNDIVPSIQGPIRPVVDMVKHSISAKALRKIRQREAGRINQARYRERQKRIEPDMKCEIAKLKADIASLIERRNDSLQLNGSFQFLTSPRVWLIAAEYVHHFSSYILSTVEPVELLHQASKFLNTVMVSDVIIGSHFGIEAQLENWRLYAQFFDKIQLGLRSMHMSTTETLVACTCVSVTITNRTLQQGFPHLNSDGTGGTKGGVWSPVAVRMLDQKLIMCGTVKFGLDVMDKVTRVDFQADMMTPMTKLLHNLRTVSYAFTKARITPDFYIVRDVDI